MSEVLQNLKKRIERKNQSKGKMPKNQSSRPFLNFLLERQRRRLSFMEKLLIHRQVPYHHDLSVDDSLINQPKRRRLSYIG